MPPRFRAAREAAATPSEARAGRYIAATKRPAEHVFASLGRAKGSGQSRSGVDEPMPGKVIVVNRAEKLGLLERLYVPMILKGLRVTAGHFFRNLRGFVTGKNRTDFVVQYPEERVDYPDAFRGMPVLVQLDNGQPKCVACGLCEFACPTDCISIVPAEIEDARIERYPEAFDIDMSRCMFCGLCEEACPEEAIVMSREVELSTYDRGSMVYDKERLLVPEALLKRRLGFLRAEYDREHAEPQR